jgi:hypothetical protein
MSMGSGLPKIPARSRLIGPGAIYALNPCTEQAARLAIESFIASEIVLLEMPDKSPELLVEWPHSDAIQEEEEA